MALSWGTLRLPNFGVLSGATMKAISTLGLLSLSAVLAVGLGCKQATEAAKMAMTAYGCTF